MVGLGAKEVERDFFLDALEHTLQNVGDWGSWQDFEWKYKD
jgi:hypothetical protein